MLFKITFLILTDYIRADTNISVIGQYRPITSRPNRCIGRALRGKKVEVFLLSWLSSLNTVPGPSLGPFQLVPSQYYLSYNGVVERRPVKRLVLGLRKVCSLSSACLFPHLPASSLSHRGGPVFGFYPINMAVISMK